MEPRRVLLWGGVVLLVVTATLGLSYRAQIWSLLTHRKGAPTRTWEVTPPVDDPLLRVAVAGDVGEGEEEEWVTADAMEIAADDDAYDVLLLLGDNVYPSGDPDQLDATVFRPFGTVLRSGARLLAIVGNHDAPHEAEQMRRLGMSGPWWAVTIDDVLFVGLDSNRVDDPAQRAWLERTLAGATQTWRVVAVHEPPYSAGYQGSNEAVRSAFGPLFERYGVQLVLSGHEHDYQRSVPIDGVTYVISGAGGRTRGTGEEAFTAASYSVLHFVELNVYEDTIVLRAITQTPRVFDDALIPAS